ncbi:type II secretion system protein N [Spongorhabdus nitratireducens]
MKKAILLSLLALVAFTASLIFQVPAAVLWQQAQTYFPKQTARVQLEGVDGTLWSGSADRITFRGKTFPQPRWQLTSVSPLDRQIGLDLQLGQSRSQLSLNAHIEISEGEVAILNTKGRIGGQELTRLMGNRLPINIDGQIRLTLDEWRFWNGRCQSFDGQGQLQNLVVDSKFGSVNLGQGKLELSCEGGKLAAKLTQNSDEVTSSLKLNLLSRSSYQLQGQLTPQANLDKQLQRGLSYLGKPESDGSYQVSYKGRI